MMIHHTVSDFLAYYEPTTDYLKHYFKKNARHFEKYFTYHCKNMGEKLKVAVPKYLEKMDDLHSSPSADLFRQWFSINGGTIFGYTRLAYYIGYELTAALVQEYGEHETVTIWKRKDYKDILLGQLEAMLHQ
ncbi:MAG: hypothetical protein ACI33P_12120 [Lysinibacillus sp.]